MNTETTDEIGWTGKFFGRVLIAGQVSVLGLGAAALSVFGFGHYGIGLFVYLPIVVGFLSVFLLAAHGPVGPGSAMGFALLSVVGVGAMMLSLGMEGVICLLMAFPLWVPEAMLGAGLGLLLLQWVRSAGRRALIIVALMATAPLVLGAEWALSSEPPLVAVRTAVEIDAPRSEVWRRVIAFEPLPQPREWLFRAGVAYPIGATITGTGVGALRRCVFSTGAFIEPITHWDEPRMLAFDVVENPAPMRELSFHDVVHAPHLHGFFVSERGRFDLVDLGNGRTRLEGATWYRHDIGPQWYWRLWSDHIIHKIHWRVLNHIKTTTETEVRHDRSRLDG